MINKVNNSLASYQMTRNNLCMFLHTIKEDVKIEQENQLKALEEKRIQALRNAKTMEDIEWIELCSATDKENVLSSYNTDRVILYRK